MNRNLPLCVRMVALLPALLLLAAAAALVAGPEAGASHVEAPLAFGKVIPVELQAGTKAKPGTLVLAWIVFEKGDDGIQATLRAAMTSAPKGKWQIAVQLLDPQGKAVAADHVVIENDGTMLGVALVHEGELHFSFKRQPELLTAKRFRVDVSEAGKEVSTTGRLARLKRRRRPKGRFSLTVSLDGGETPADELGEIITWRLVEDTEPAGPLEGLSALHGGKGVPRWHDPATGQTWEPSGCRAYRGGPATTTTLSKLLPGTYRVTAVSSSTTDPSPAGASQSMRLSDENPVGELAVRLEGEYPLLVKVVRADTGQPLPATYIALCRADGMPLVAGSNQRGRYTDDKGWKAFRSLAPGSYSIHAGLHRDRRRWEMRPSSTLVVVPVTVGPGKPMKILVKLPAAPKQRTAADAENAK